MYEKKYTKRYIFNYMGRLSGIEPESPVPQTGVITIIP